MYVNVGRHLFIHFELINIHSLGFFCPFKEILENLLPASSSNIQRDDVKELNIWLLQCEHSTWK